MSYLPLVPPDPQTAETFETVRATFGFLPNFFQYQTLRPDLIQAELGLIGSVLAKPGALTRQQKEYVFLVCSAANLSTYCVTAHCEIVRMLKLEGPEPEQIAVDYASSDLSMSMKALLGFALKLNAAGGSQLRPDDVAALRKFGHTDQQILEAVLVVGIAHFANVVSFGLGTVPDFDNPSVAFPAANRAGG